MKVDGGWRTGLRQVVEVYEKGRIKNSKRPAVSYQAPFGVLGFRRRAVGAVLRNEILVQSLVGFLQYLN